jgi:hypothetical protein
MGDRKSEAGSRVEALQKQCQKKRRHPTQPPTIFLLQHSSLLAPWLLSWAPIPFLQKLKNDFGKFAADAIHLLYLRHRRSPETFH